MWRRRDKLIAGQEPGLADLLTTLELTTMYEHYFSPEELKQLPMLAPDSAPAAEWQAVAAEARALMERGTRTDSAAAQAVALRWMRLLVRDTNGDPRLFARLNQMHQRAPAMHGPSGVTPELMEFVIAAFNERRMALYARHLSADEIDFMRAHIGERNHEWPALIAELYTAMENGTAPDHPAARQLALRWLDLFQSYAGTDPATHAKFRRAHELEPALMDGTWISPRLLGFLTSAFAQLRPR